MSPICYLLHARGMTTTRLARLIGCQSHSQISQVLRNRPGRGHWVRRKLAPYLTESELNLLGWDVLRGTFRSESERI